MPALGPESLPLLMLPLANFLACNKKSKQQLFGSRHAWDTFREGSHVLAARATHQGLPNALYRRLCEGGQVACHGGGLGSVHKVIHGEAQLADDILACNTRRRAKSVGYKLICCSRIAAVAYTQSDHTHSPPQGLDSLALRLDR